MLPREESTQHLPPCLQGTFRALNGWVLIYLDEVEVYLEDDNDVEEAEYSNDAVGETMRDVDRQVPFVS